MHPLGLTDDWADKLAGEAFSDDSAGITYEHYMQVQYRTTCVPAPVQAPAPVYTCTARIQGCALI